MDSGKWFLHTHVIEGDSAIILVLPPSLPSVPCVSWDGSYQCEDSHRRKCQLNLRSLHTAVHLLSAVTRYLHQRGGAACLVTIRQGALWHSGWCATVQDLRCALCWV